MDTKLILKTLLSYYINTQHIHAVGDLVSSCSNPKSVLILTAPKSAVDELEEAGLAGISVMDEDMYLSLIGVSKPMIPETAGMIALLTAALEAIDKLERKAERLKKQLETLDAQYTTTAVAAAAACAPLARTDQLTGPRIIDPVEERNITTH